MTKIPITAALLLIPQFPFYCACADIIELKNGKRFEGRINQEGNNVVIEILDSKVVLPRDVIKSVEKKPYVLDEYDNKFAQLKANDVNGTIALADWCMNKGLVLRARKLYAQVLESDPTDRAAISGLRGERVKKKPEKKEKTEEDFGTQYSRKAKQTKMGDPEALFRLAMWCRDQGREDLAVTHLAQVLQIVPYHKRAVAALTEAPEAAETKKDGATIQEAVAPEARPLKQKERTSEYVVEGVGYGKLTFGMTREEVVQILSAPDSVDERKTCLWLSYRGTRGLSVLIDKNEGLAAITFTRTFPVPLQSGIRIGSTLEEVLSTYGQPRRVVSVESTRGLDEDRVLYETAGHYRITYHQKGILFWFAKAGGSRLSQFIISKPQNE